MADVLNEIYENIFYDFSYGFRPKKNCHQAISQINWLIMTKKINYILDADIKGFFDNIDHDILIMFLEHEIADKNFLICGNSSVNSCNEYILFSPLFGYVLFTTTI